MEKLYEENPYSKEFTATVVACSPCETGFEIVLDRTAFYPEGGGQPCDTGTLSSANVVQVQEREGQLIHTCDTALSVGTEVVGAIHWARRFDLMQHHTGEHIVSGLAHSQFGCDNVGFHMGSDVVTIDLNVVLDMEQLQWLEAAANRYIWEDHPICVTLPTPTQLEKLEYRSKKALSGQVRIVTCPGADICACCGTHVSTAGQVGLVKLLGLQKFREGVRIELVCGGRALAYFNGLEAQNRQISNLLSAKPMETAGAVARLLGETAALKSRILTREETYFTTLAQAHAGAGDVLLFESGLAPDALRRLCDAVLQRCGGRCACFCAQEGGGFAYAMGERGGDLRQLVKRMNTQLNGRGGGKPEFVQGAVQAQQGEISAFFAGLA